MKSLSLALLLLNLFLQLNGLYFYLLPEKERCFKDELVADSQISVKVNLLQEEVSEYVRKSRNALTGIEVRILDSSQTEGMEVVAKSDQLIQYTTMKNGEYQVCLKLSDEVFNQTEVKEVKAELKFSNIYFKLAENSKSKGKEQLNEKISETSTHIDTLQKRLKRITQTVDDIIHHQNNDRHKNDRYQDKILSYTSKFSWFIYGQILVLLGCAAYSVVSLRKFFVKKHIY